MKYYFPKSTSQDLIVLQVSQAALLLAAAAMTITATTNDFKQSRSLI